jgi:serine/threonine protein kinase
VDTSSEAVRIFEDSKMEIHVLSSMTKNTNILGYIGSTIDISNKNSPTVLIAMELLTANTLYDIFEKGDFKNYSFTKRICILKQIHGGLIHIHGHGFVHLDICLNNVMYDEGTGRVIIVDFGFSKFSHPSKRPTIEAQSNKQLSSQRGGLGTPGYMASENSTHPHW